MTETPVTPVSYELLRVDSDDTYGRFGEFETEKDAKRALKELAANGQDLSGAIFRIVRILRREIRPAVALRTVVVLDGGSTPTRRRRAEAAPTEVPPQ